MDWIIVHRRKESTRPPIPTMRPASRRGCHAIVVLLVLAIGIVDSFQSQRPARIGPTSSRTRALLVPRSSKGHVQSTTALKAISPFAAVAYPVGSVAILALIVVVHELGHYLAAKRIGVAVEEFSVGFGPKLLGFTRANGDVFNLRAFPLGGYVRFPENYNLTAVDENRQIEFEAQTKFIKEQNYGAAWKIGNVLTVGILEDRVWQKEKKRRAQVAADETKKINASFWRKLLGGGGRGGGGGGTKKSRRDASSAVDDAAIDYYDDPDLLQNRPWTQRAQVISGGVIFNFLLAFFLYFGQIGFGAGIPIPKFTDGVIVNSVTMASPASGKLERGDVILSVNGSPLEKADALVGRNGVDKFIATVRSVPDGQTLDLTIIHGGKQRQIQIAPQRVQPGASPTIGVVLSPNVAGMDVLQAKDPLTALSLAYKYVSTLTVQTAQGYGMVFVGLFSGSGSAGLSGPVGLIKAGSEVVSTRDWTTVILFASAISINLAVLNSLPIPALDGGQMVFVLSEALTGKKVNQQLEERITSAAVLFLIVMSLVIFAGDLSAP